MTKLENAVVSQTLVSKDKGIAMMILNVWEILFVGPRTVTNQNFRPPPPIVVNLFLPPVADRLLYIVFVHRQAF